MRLLGMSSFLMLGFGVLLLLAGLFGPAHGFGIVFGLLMIVSGIVKVIAVRIMLGPQAAQPRQELDQR